MEADIRFYRETFGMVLFRGTLSDADQNRFSRFPEGSSTRCAFLQGKHMFGKVCLTQPVDTPPSMTGRAVAPNIGYVAQIFRVNDAAAALRRAEATGARLYAPLATARLPGLDAASVASVRTPGSGALILIAETHDERRDHARGGGGASRRTGSAALRRPLRHPAWAKCASACSSADSTRST